MHGHDPEISVVVPVRDGAGSLPALLKSLADQDLDDERYEVVVVDNASRDETAAIAASGGARVVFEPHPNRSGARNAGARAALANVLAFTDADCVAAPSWLRSLLLCRGRAPLVAGAVRMQTRGAPNVIERFDSDARFRQERGLRQGWAATANLLVERDAFDAIRGFDVEYRHIGEDVDFCLRAGRAGYGLDFCPDAIVYHHAETELSPVLRRSFRHGYSATQLKRRLGTGHDAWRTAHIALSPRASLTAHSVRVAGRPRRDQAAYTALSMGSYASRVAGSLWASARRVR